jgi:hypothetical protein
MCAGQAEWPGGPARRRSAAAAGSAQPDLTSRIPNSSGGTR